MTSIKDMAMRMIMQNPSIANNPNARAMVDVIQSGDQKRGEELANNLLNTHGVSREDALRQARRFFHF